MIKTTLISIYLGCLITAIYFLSPLLATGENPRITIAEHFQKMDLANFQYDKNPQASSSSEADFLYRGNVGRWGLVWTEKTMKEPQVTFQGEPLNFGVHTASKSSVAVDDSGYYVGTDEGRFYAFDFQNKIRWSYNFISSGRGIHGTATTDKDHVYIGNYRGHLLCFRKSDGKILWETVIANAIGTSPLLIGDFLYVAAEFNVKMGMLVKISKWTGQKVWQSETFREQTHSSPATSEDGRIIVVGDNAGVLRGIDSQSGQTIWKEQMAGPIKNSPMVHNQSVYVGSWNNEFCSFDYTSGKKNWCKGLEGLIQTSAALEPDSGDVFVKSSAKSVLYRLKSETGEVVWKKASPLSRTGMSSPVVLVSKSKQTQLLASCGKTDLCLFDVSKGKVKATLKLPSTFSSVPSVYKDEIFLSLDLGGIVRLK